MTTLQQQVLALQESRDFQDRELSRLRTEAMELANRVSSTDGSKGAGAARSKLGSLAEEQVGTDC